MGNTNKTHTQESKQDTKQTTDNQVQNAQTTQVPINFSPVINVALEDFSKGKRDTSSGGTTIGETKTDLQATAEADAAKPPLKIPSATLPPPKPLIGVEDVVPAMVSAATSFAVCYGLGMPTYDSGLAAATSGGSYMVGNGVSRMASGGAILTLGVSAGLNTGAMMIMGADTTEVLSVVAASTIAAAAPKYMVMPSPGPSAGQGGTGAPTPAGAAAGGISTAA